MHALTKAEVMLKSRRYRTGVERLKSAGTALKDAVAPLRKSLIAFARK